MFPWFWAVIIFLIVIIFVVVVFFVINQQPLPDLLIEKIDSPDPVMAGGILTYTLIVTNNGLADATDVEIVDAIPSEVEFVQSQPFPCLQSNPPGPITCDMGTIRSNETKQVDVQVRVKTTTPNSLIANTATVTDGADANTSDNVDTEFTTVEGVKSQKADYGDAPDGQSTTYFQPFAQTGNFPSYFSNDGLRAIGPSTVWLSSPNYNFEISYELDYDDPADSDGVPNLDTDFDDGFDYDFLRDPSSPPNMFIGTLNVHFWLDGTAVEAAYLNLFLDKNMDGDWDDLNEHMIIDDLVFYTGPTPIDKKYSFPNFVIDVDKGEGCYWTRATISTVPISSTFGEGVFDDGEVEDWLLRYPHQRCDGAAFGEAGGWPPIGSTP